MNADRLLSYLERCGDPSGDSLTQLRKLIVALAINGRLGANDRVPVVPESRPVQNDELPVLTLNAERFVRLSTVAEIRKGLTGIQKAKPGKYPLVVTAKERATTDHYDFEGEAAIVPLISSTGHGKASLHRLHYQDGRFAVGNILAAVFPHDPAIVTARFLFEYMTAFKEELLVSRMTGTANVALTVGKLASIPIPLVSISTQTKVDELMQLCDRLESSQSERESRRDRLVVASLNRLSQATDPNEFKKDAGFQLSNLNRLSTKPEHIKELRKVILNLAVRGKLVPQDEGEGTAEQVYTQVCAVKRKLLEEGRLKLDKKQVSATIEPPFGIPESWKWLKLQDLWEISRGSSPRPAGDPRFFGGPIPWITVGEVTKDGGRYLLSVSTGLTDEGAARSRMVEPEDLLLTNSGATLGVPKISRIRGCINDGVAVLRQFHGYDSNRFAYLYLSQQTPIFRAVNQGMGQPNLNTPIIAGWWFPLAPLAEQKRIVAKVDELMLICDQLETQLESQQKGRRQLLEALLHEALEGVG